MAKKKVSQDNNKTSKKQPEAVTKPNSPTAMDSESNEKLDNLKTLNQMLLKQAVERRQQVDSLTNSNLSLESDLTRSISEKNSLKSDLNRFSEMSDKLELEKSVMSVFIAVQMSRNEELVENRIVCLENEVEELRSVVEGKESEIGVLNEKLSEIESALGEEMTVSKSVSVERDALKGRVDLLVKESERLKVKLNELETRKAEMKREIGDLRVAYDCVVKEKEGTEKRIGETVKENDLYKKELVELNKVIGETRERLRETVGEKERVEAERNGEVVKRAELEKLVSGLNETVAGLRKEVDVRCASISDLEIKCVESEAKCKEISAEIVRLVEEKKLGEKRVEGLMGEKSMLEKNLREAMEELEKERHKVGVLVIEKSTLVEARGNQDKVVFSLQNQVDEMRSAVLNMEEHANAMQVARENQDKVVFSLQNQVDEMRSVVLNMEEHVKAMQEAARSMESTIEDSKRKLEHVEVEKDEIAICLDEEKQNTMALKEIINNYEKKVAELLDVAAEDKTKFDALSAQKSNLNGECESLKKEIASLETALKEARNKLGVMKGEFESAGVKSEMFLNMLKDTAAFCLTDEKQIFGEESAIEFEMIKNAFKSKEAKIDSLKNQLEFLQDSVVEVNKKKSFWTALSSATTLLAAVSLAYVARGAGR